MFQPVEPDVMSVAAGFLDPLLETCNGLPASEPDLIRFDNVGLDLGAGASSARPDGEKTRLFWLRSLLERGRSRKLIL